MKFLIVTGMSGAGKSTALRKLEDSGYFCVDNLPLPLVDKFAELAAAPGVEYTRAALGLDVRSIRDAQDVSRLLELLDDKRYTYEVLFLECSDETLVSRFKETRRSHPLSRGGRVTEGVKKERQLLAPLRDRANLCLNTDGMSARTLGMKVEKRFAGSGGGRMVVTALSFGFKHGIPTDADLVFDVRFLPNPYYDEKLRPLTGNEKEVQDFVLGGDTAREFEKRWFALLDYLLPCYAAEGKTQLVIAVGCTGGHHRSVTMANRLYQHLSAAKDIQVRIEHRDI